MTKISVTRDLTKDILDNIVLPVVDKTTYVLGVDEKWADRVVFYLSDDTYGDYLSKLFYLKVEEPSADVYKYRVVGNGQFQPKSVLASGVVSSYPVTLGRHSYENITEYCTNEIDALNFAAKEALKDDFFVTDDNISESRKGMNEDVNNGLIKLSDKIERATGLKFYGDPGEIDILGDDNEAGVADYIIATTEDDKTVYLIKYLDGDYEVAIWADADESPSVTMRDSDLNRVASYAIEKIGGKR